MPQRSANNLSPPPAAETSTSLGPALADPRPCAVASRPISARLNNRRTRRLDRAWINRRVMDKGTSGILQSLHGDEQQPSHRVGDDHNRRHRSHVEFLND